MSEEGKVYTVPAVDQTPEQKNKTMVQNSELNRAMRRKVAKRQGWFRKQRLG